MKKLALILTIFFAGTYSVKAQDMIFNIDYNFGYTTGSMSEFISTTAYRGGGMNYTKFLESNENLGVGLSIDWDAFYRKMPRESFPFYEGSSSVSTTDINAVQFRYMYTLPILVGMDYYFIKDEFFLPYVGINVGTIYTEQELYISAYDNEINTAWDFAYGVEAGFHLVFGESGIGMNLIAKYNMSSYNYTFTNIGLETTNPSYVSLGVGLSFLMMNYY